MASKGSYARQRAGEDTSRGIALVKIEAEGLPVKGVDEAVAGADVVNILRKKRLTLTGFRVKVQGEQAPTPPWAFQKIHIHYEVEGPDIRDKDVERAIELSEEKYCSVSATLKPQVEITWDYALSRS